MKLFLIALLCSVAAAFPRGGLRIVNGKKGTPGKEYLAAIRLGKTGVHIQKQFCGGSVIGDRHILTAAHCFAGLTYTKDFFTVGLGSYDLNQLVTYEVDAIFCHDEYNDKTYDNDICIVKLAKPIDFSNRNIKKVNLPALREELPYHKKASVIGWGVIKFESGDSPTFALETEMEILKPTDRSCAPYGVNDSKFCAGNNGVAISSTCQGDSGGPVVYNGKVYGVVSYAVGCNEPEFSGVYARVSTYVDWIAKQMKK